MVCRRILLRVPLIEDLTKEPIPPGTTILVEYDPASQWYLASLNMAAGWLKLGGKAEFASAIESPTSIRSKLARLGLDAIALENEGRLELHDLYTATLGLKSTEKYVAPSLKVADMSLHFGKMMSASPDPDKLWIMVDMSFLDRFNEETTWVNFLLSRPIPLTRVLKRIGIRGIMTGVHSEKAYKKLEAASDGIVDFRLDEKSNPPKNVMRIRNLRETAFDGSWHTLTIGENFGAAFAD